MKRPKIKDFSKDDGQFGCSLTFRPSRTVFRFERTHQTPAGGDRHSLAGSTKPSFTDGGQDYDQRSVRRLAIMIANAD